MGFDFAKLPRKAQRAAFANMSAQGRATDAVKAAVSKASGGKALGSRSLGTGDRHAKLTAIKSKLAENQADDGELVAIGEQMKSRQITPAQARERLAALRARRRSRAG